MKITDIRIMPEKKTADVWDALTETAVHNSSDIDRDFHLKTYILNESDNSVGKTETDFTVKAGATVLVRQSVLSYSPVINKTAYRMVCELYEKEQPADKQTVEFGFTV